jgi:hypothetical protein
MPQCHRLRILQEIAQALDTLNATGQEQILYLTQPPFTESDQDFLRDVLGRGNVTIFSNEANASAWQETGVPCVWLGEYRDGIERVVLRTIEIAPYPPLAAWRKESIAEATLKLNEILAKSGQ